MNKKGYKLVIFERMGSNMPSDIKILDTEFECIHYFIDNYSYESHYFQIGII